MIIVEPNNQLLIQVPLQSMIQLNCNGTRNDLLGLVWQVRIRNEGLFTIIPKVLVREDIILSGDTVSLSRLDITGSQSNSGTVFICVASIPRQGGDGFVQCSSEEFTIDVYGTYK